MRNITITKSQEKYIIKHKGKMNYKIMAEKLGLSYGKLMANIFLMGINRKEIRQADFDDGNGFFDLKKWSELYKY